MENNPSSREVGVITSEELAGQVRTGTLSAMFLPAANYNVRSNGQFYRVALPIRGQFPEEEGHPFSGQKFDLCPGGGSVLFGDMLKVMFATGSYPKLRDKERFVLIALEVSFDKVILIGEVVELLEE